MKIPKLLYNFMQRFVAGLKIQTKYEINEKLHITDQSKEN